MKRRLLPLTALFLLLCYAAVAQPDGKFEEWGQVTYGDLQIKECLFEKNADALLILDLGEVFFQKEADSARADQFSITSAYYRRYKVLTEKGVEYAKFSQSYSRYKHELLSHVKAACYNYEHGKMVKTELAITDVHYKTIDEDETEVSFTVPGVKKGSVFEIAYERNQLVVGDLPEWYFNSDIPCLQSTLRVGFLDAIEYHIHKQVTHKKYEEKNEPFVSDIKVKNGYNWEFLKGKTLTYTAFNLPTIRNEPYMNSRWNYTNNILFLFKAYLPPLDTTGKVVVDWERLNNWLLDEPRFAQHLTDSGIPRKEITDLLKNSGLENGSAVDKAKAIFEFVRKNVKWDGTVSAVATPTNAETWERKSGHSAAINLLLLNTLLQEGIKAYPMLVGARDYGYLYTQFPMPNDFRNVVVVIEQDDNKKLVLDARYRVLPFGIPAYDLLNNYGYVLRSRNDGYWYYITSDVTDAEVVLIKGKLDNAGLIKGEININYNNYSQAEYRYIKAEGRQDILDKHLKEIVPLATIENVTDSVDEVNSKVLQKIKFDIKPAADTHGKIYIAIPSIYNTGENPFVSNERTSDIDLGYKRKSSVVLQLEIPKDYTIDSLQAPVLLQTADSSISFSCNVEKEGQTLLMRQKLDYRKSFYPLQDYNSVYDFHQKYFTIMQQPVLLRKKD